MAKGRITFTFTDANIRHIVSRWGSVDAWKAWVKQQTLPPPPSSGSYPATYTERT